MVSSIGQAAVKVFLIDNLPITFSTERSAYLVFSENFFCVDMHLTLVDIHFFTISIIRTLCFSI